MQIFKVVSKVTLALFFAAGVNHFRDPVFYEAIMPPYLPWHTAAVFASGIAEVVLGVGLLIPRFSRFAAWSLIALLIAVFPANIHMATHPELYSTIPAALLWLRLPLQAVLVLWAYWLTRIESGPKIK